MERMLVLSLMSFLTCLSALPLAAQQVGQGGVFQPHEVDQLKVDKAIEKGVAYLKSGNAGHLAMSNHVDRQISHCELVLYTYVHADVPETDPDFQTLFQDMMKRPLEATYCVALQAMVLEEMDRVKYQWRIRQCAQFLVDNQVASGRWSYGAPSIYVEELPASPTEAPKRDVASGGGKIKDFGGGVQPGSKKKDKPAIVKKVRVEKKRDGTGGGDNSNTQYAALGLRACHDAGIILPAEVVERGMKWWRDSQKEEKGDPEALIEGGVNGPERPRVGSGSGATVAAPAAPPGTKAVPNGWCYLDHDDHEAYGSMSAGAIGSLAIFNYIKDDDGGKKKSWKKDKDIHEGLVWVAKKFSVAFNPGPYEHGDKARDSRHQFYYYLYALERAGMLYGTEIMGTHKWYPEGAKQLIEEQKAGGDWGGAVDTCFAVLFLKRATKPLDVATHSVGSRK